MQAAVLLLLTALAGTRWCSLAGAVVGRCGGTFAPSFLGRGAMAASRRRPKGPRCAAAATIADGGATIVLTARAGVCAHDGAAAAGDDVCAAVAAVRAGVPSNAIFGNFDAVASQPTYGVAAWDHVQQQWRVSFQAQTAGDLPRNLQPLSVTRSDQFFAWDAANGAVLHYINDTTLASPAGGASVARLGRDKLVLAPNGPITVLASYGAVAVWFCGAITSIGGNDTGHPNTQQIYEATRLDSYESLIWTLATPPDLVVTGVDCSTFRVFSNVRAHHCPSGASRSRVGVARFRATRARGGIRAASVDARRCVLHVCVRVGACN
jgi:hypothetical protein